MMNVLKLALLSVWRWLGLIFTDTFHRRKERVGRIYHFKKEGEYRIFRDTESTAQLKGKHVVLIVGFRLKWLGRNRLAHKLFRKLCILTVPFWAGFEGYHIKLWMHRVNGWRYLGIYDWAGKENAEQYAQWLVKILKPLSLPDTVWYKIHEQDFEKYLEEHEYKMP